MMVCLEAYRVMGISPFFLVESFTDQDQDQDVKLLNHEVLGSAINVATG